MPNLKFVGCPMATCKTPVSAAINTQKSSVCFILPSTVKCYFYLCVDVTFLCTDLCGMHDWGNDSMVPSLSSGTVCICIMCAHCTRVQVFQTCSINGSDMGTGLSQHHILAKPLISCAVLSYCNNFMR